MHHLFDRHEISSAIGVNDWRQVLFKEFEAALISSARPFPCIFGVAGLKANQLRFAFPDPLTPEALAPLLKSYLSKARSYGPNTSLVILSRPGPVRGLDAYRLQFWSLLSGLAAIDDHPWPADIPEVLDTPGWEFSFAGEPIFVVCNTPAHVHRQSRRSTGFMMTFQPRWVFDTILGSEVAAAKAFAKVRERLASYDLIPASPALGQYGDPDNREFAQYFLDDDNERAVCPFHSLTKQKEQAA
jgi:uncharacterized protein